MTDTIHLGMPFIEGSQAQKHVTHNEALRILDDVVQLGVLDANRAAPPATPTEGDRHIVASGASGDWAGQVNAVAVYEDGAWRFLAPRPGWSAWSAADAALLVYDGSSWSGVGGGGGGVSGSVAQLGINDTVSAPNLLTVRSNAALFNAIAVADSGTGDMRVQISKEDLANIASVFFSHAFSGRAEFGLTGDDDFHLKVSADGATWREAMIFDRGTGRVSFPAGSDVAAPSGSANRIVNPSGQVNQGGSGAAANGSYWFDQWVVLTQSGPITPLQLTNQENGTPFMMRYTQSNATAQRFGVIQPLESANVLDLRGSPVTLSARVRASAATTLRYAIVEWTGTADVITKDIVADWTNGAFTAGNFFNASGLTLTATGSTALSASTLTSISLTGTVSGAMNNLLVFVWTDAAQTQNATLDIGKVQLERGSVASPLAFRSYHEELNLARRYFYNGAPRIVGISQGSAIARIGGRHPVPMMKAPTLTMTSALPVYDGSTPTTISAISSNESTAETLEFECSTVAATGAGRPVVVYAGSGGNLNVDARL